jgi:hypothetical protein
VVVWVGVRVEVKIRVRFRFRVRVEVRMSVRARVRIRVRVQVKVDLAKKTLPCSRYFAIAIASITMSNIDRTAPTKRRRLPLSLWVVFSATTKELLLGAAMELLRASGVVKDDASSPAGFFDGTSCRANTQCPKYS